MTDGEEEDEAEAATAADTEELLMFGRMLGELRHFFTTHELYYGAIGWREKLWNATRWKFFSVPSSRYGNPRRFGFAHHDRLRNMNVCVLRPFHIPARLWHRTARWRSPWAWAYYLGALEVPENTPFKCGHPRWPWIRKKGGPVMIPGRWPWCSKLTAERAARKKGWRGTFSRLERSETTSSWEW